MRALLFSHRALLLAALCFSACAHSAKLRDPITGTKVPDEFVGTLGVSEQSSPLTEPVLLRSVDTVSGRDFDRVIFRFDGGVAPGYKAEYIDQPIRRCASGEALAVAGNAWLELRMVPAQGHQESAQSTVANRNRHFGYPNLRQLVETCDFEGHNAWVLGLNSPNRYRVVELTNPPRLVVDVKHQ